MMQLYPMSGGLVLDTHRQATLNLPPVGLPLPPTLQFQLQQPYFRYRPLVEIGDLVQANQRIATATSVLCPDQGLHTGLGGIISALDAYTITITCERPQTPSLSSPPNSAPQPTHLQENLQQHLQSMGILGLGGAGFPTAGKLQQPHTLLINGVECEPYLTADACLMTHKPAQIFAGIAALQEAMAFKTCIFTIEADKSLAIRSIQTTIQTMATTANLKLAIVPQRYPAGGERQVYEQVFGSRLQPSEKISNKGVVCLNVQTLAAIGQAQVGQPLVRRLVTLTGDALIQPINAELYIGTSVAWLLQQLPLKSFAITIRRGGPIMGQLITPEATITPGTTALLFQQQHIIPQAQPCIHCGQCEPVCPEHLQPQLLIQYVQAPPKSQVLADIELDTLQLDACIGCSVCDLVCPSHIPLGASFTSEKRRRQKQQDREQRAQTARATYEARTQRLARPVRANPLKPAALVQASRPASSQVTPSQSVPLTRLKTNLAKAQRLEREASAALTQAEKKGLDPVTLDTYSARVKQLSLKTAKAKAALDAATKGTHS